jgi:hypothetical protein
MQFTQRERPVDLKNPECFLAETTRDPSARKSTHLGSGGCTLMSARHLDDAAWIQVGG